MNRTGERGHIPARNERFFRSGEYWYYTTREGVDIGPFDSQTAAVQGARDFVDFIREAEPEVSELLERHANAA